MKRRNKVLRGYLELIPAQSRVNRRQSRMTRLCIFLAVFLIAAIFGMADMEVRSQLTMTRERVGSWHAAFAALTDEEVREAAGRADVRRVSRYAVTNYELNLGITLEGTETAVCGFDETLPLLMPAAGATEGRLPQSADEVVVTRGMRQRLGLSLGDTIAVRLPETGAGQAAETTSGDAGQAAETTSGDAGQQAETTSGDARTLTLRICGFTGDTSMLTNQDAFGIFLSMDGYRRHFSSFSRRIDEVLYVEFAPGVPVQRAIAQIQEAYGVPDGDLGRNEQLLGLTLQSADSYFGKMYLTALVLAGLVMTAAVLMIAGSMQTSVANRTEFFGMLRCIGASGRQIRRYVRREALYWCVRAIPAALLAATALVWALCAVLRGVSQEYFAALPQWAVSWPGMAAGAGLGLLTVLWSAQSPARRAGAVSPLAAMRSESGAGISGGRVKKVRGAERERPADRQRRAQARLLRGRLPVELSLGLRHALENRRTFWLMTLSFAFSILLFLSFSTLLPFMNRALRPLLPDAPDFVIERQESAPLLPPEFAETIAARPEVKRVFVTTEDGTKTELRREAAVQETADGQKQLGGKAVGDEQARGKADVRGYACLDIQFYRTATDVDVAEIRETAERMMREQAKSAPAELLRFSDKRLSNQETKSMYLTFAVCMYGFLSLIALICVCSIVNSVQMSAAARRREYGAMRAIGTSARQLRAMIGAEAAAYGFCGTALGLAVGLPLHRFLFGWLVTSRWGDAWQPPMGATAVILAAVAAAVMLAVFRSGAVGTAGGSTAPQKEIVLSGAAPR